MPLRQRQPLEPTDDWAFARAGTWPEFLAVHDQWMTDYNYQDHFAHHRRPEDRRSPAAVLHRVCGRLFTPADLHRIFYTTRFGRMIDRAGYLRFRRWRVYAERGLPGQQDAVWLYAEHLTMVYRDEPLAQYQVAYQPDKRHLKAVVKEASLRHAPPLAAAAAVGLGQGRVGDRAAPVGVCAPSAADRRGGTGLPLPHRRAGGTSVNGGRRRPAETAGE